MAAPTVHSLALDFASYPFLKWDERELNAPTLKLKAEELHRGSVFEAGVDAGFQWTYHPAGKSAFFFEVPQAYMGSSDDLSPVRLKLGRKLQHWSHLDESWQMGIWQPRFRWDDVHPEDVGLIGAFFSVELPYFEFVVLGSPGFIPERGVSFSLENGSVVSGSPWFLPPPSAVKVLDEVTAVEYSIALPRSMDIVRHAGLSVFLKLGGEDGAWVSSGYAYKPMNQLLLAFDGYLQLDGQGPEVAHATIYPRVLYHHLNSLEAGYRNDFLRASISALSERPERDFTQSGWTTQEVKPALAVSPELSFILGGTRKEPARLEVGYLRVWGGNAPDGVSGGGGFSQPSASVFEPRYPFEQAARIGWRAGLGEISWKTQVLEDLKNQGTILSTELRYRPAPFWEMALGADVLGIRSSQADSSSSFIGRYQSNDRVHAGVTYVF